MIINKKYLVPSYYKNFVCKCGQCRHTCCNGWNIVISLKEYYRLESLSCSKKLRKMLDCALHILPGATNERYAMIAPNFYGDCPMHDKDGNCALQKEMKEKALPTICRYYPRNFCNSFDYEASISNSCEKVVEMLIASDDVLSFEEEILSFDYDVELEMTNQEYKHRVQNFLISVMNNREYSYDSRIYILGLILKDIEEFNIEYVEKKYNNHEYHNIEKSKVDYNYNFSLQHKIINRLASRSNSLSVYLEQIEKYYNISFQDELINIKDEGIKYKEAIENFKLTYSNWEIILEKVMNNHLYYESFPFSTLSFKDEYIALLASYSFLKFLLTSYTMIKNDLNSMVDIIGEAFRFIEHSSFEKDSDIILFNELFGNDENITKLINI